MKNSNKKDDKMISTLRTALALLLCLAFTTPAIAKNSSDKKHNKKIDWEILVDANQEITFFANDANSGISTDLFGPFVPGSTYWIKGNLYPAGSVNPNTFQVDECKKIGEWYCTGTRVRDIYGQVSPGDLYEEAYFTFRLNNGRVIFTKHDAFVGEPTITHVLFSNIKGVKAGDLLTTDTANFNPPYVLVQHVRKVK